MTYVYRLEQKTFRREELMVIPEMETEYVAGRSKAPLCDGVCLVHVTLIQSNRVKLRIQSNRGKPIDCTTRLRLSAV